MLNMIVTGQPTDRPPLLIAHGLFGSARNWGVIARRLSDQRQVVAVDMRNHGQSDWFSGHSYPELASDLAEVIAQFGGKMDVLGHSMGGKAAMVLSLQHPELVNRMIVADIAPTGYDHTQNHLIEALQKVDLAKIKDRQEAALQMTDIDDPMLQAFLLQSLDLGGRKWRLNLDVLHREMPKIIGFPEMSGQFTGPTLFLTGANSSYVPRETRPQIKGLFPTAKFAAIPGAGHWLHAEKPREFEAAARVFLNL